jgi:hypothetical protein
VFYQPEIEFRRTGNSVFVSTSNNDLQRGEWDHHRRSPPGEGGIAPLASASIRVLRVMDSRSADYATVAVGRQLHYFEHEVRIIPLAVHHAHAALFRRHVNSNIYSMAVP